MPIQAEGEVDILIDAVAELRAVLGDSIPDSMQVKVTGPAGFSADASAAFEGINSTLLLATVALVFFLLVLIYRSPIFWVLPLAAVLVAEAVVRGLGYLLAEAGVVINGQTGGILVVLVFGAGTDYALLITARYREELLRTEDKHEAMQVALVRAGPAILASAGTVVAALLCLSLRPSTRSQGSGPVGAMGVAVAAAAMLTLLPGLLLVGGRRAFWPYVPRYGSTPRRERDVWERLGAWIERRHRLVWMGSTAALALLALGALTLDANLTTANSFQGSVESVQGQSLIEESFPAGASAPTTVLVRDPAKTQAALEAARCRRRRVGRTARVRDAGGTLRRHAHQRPVRRGGLRCHPRASRDATQRRGHLRARRRPDRGGGRSPRGSGAGHEAARAPRAARRPRDPRRAPPLGRGSRRAHGHRGALVLRRPGRKPPPFRGSSPTFRDKNPAIRSSRSSSSSPSGSTTTSSSWPASVRKPPIDSRRRRPCSRGSR